MSGAQVNGAQVTNAQVTNAQVGGGSGTGIAVDGSATIAAGALGVPLWQRLRLWVAVAAVVVLGAAAVTLSATPPGAPLDPESASKPGSHALAQLLLDRGTTVHRTTRLAGLPAAATVLVAFPDRYGVDQLRALAGDGRRLVVPASTYALGVLAPDLAARSVDGSPNTAPPGCLDAGAQAAGNVRFPGGTTVFTGANCYGGRVRISSALVVIGPSELLTNAHLADPGVAALDLNAITDNGAVRDVTWLMPGADTLGPGRPSVWELLPGWAPRAFWWLVVLGALVIIWRSRRMGPVVYEPLPVLVRAAEIVEGHGRLYRRARARESAAAALRQATRRRLARRYGLPAAHGVDEILSAAGHRTGQAPAWLAELLDGGVPVDDPALAALARDLRELECAPMKHPEQGRPPP